MKIGTRTVLFGVHQFLWHPITVILAWKKLYRAWPTWEELICIFFHDAGYIGKPNLDGPEGRTHPILGAKISRGIVYLLTRDWNRAEKAFDLALYHSRHYSASNDEVPSKLCWADKYCVLCEPRWFYWLRAKLSGELDEYKKNHEPKTGKISDWQWINYYRESVLKYPEVRKLLNLDLIEFAVRLMARVAPALAKSPYRRIFEDKVFPSGVSEEKRQVK